MLAYPGKLKLVAIAGRHEKAPGFRITRLSGEVETAEHLDQPVDLAGLGFRITRLSGEVEPPLVGAFQFVGDVSSGLLAYPGKLKLSGRTADSCRSAPAGFRITRLSGEVETDSRTKGAKAGRVGSGLLAYPGKLKLFSQIGIIGQLFRFRITRLSGEVETISRVDRPRCASRAFRITRLSGEVETSPTRGMFSSVVELVPDYSLIRGS